VDARDEVADVEVDTSTGKISVKKITVAHDCGIIVNPNGLSNQIEGNVIQGSSRALMEEVDFNTAGVKNTNWNSYPIIRFRDVPDVDIVLIDRQQPFGNEQLLPRGTLREPPSHLARASYIFITKSDGNTEELRRRISQFNGTAGLIECIHHPLYLEDVFTGERVPLDRLKGRKIASFSGIAQPESFEQSLVQLGGELVYSKRFADHHRFTQQEVLNAINRSKKRQAETIITTQKDAVRFPKIDRRDLPIYFMRVEIKILSGASDFQDCVRKICFR